MLWEVEIRPRGADVERQRVCADYDLLTDTPGYDAAARRHRQGSAVIVGSARGYPLEGDLGRAHAHQLLHELLVDPLVEEGRLRGLSEDETPLAGGTLTVLLKPGVMDPAAQSVLAAAQDLGLPLASVRTFRRYF